MADAVTTPTRIAFSSAGAVRRPRSSEAARPTGIQLNYANLLDNLAEVGPPHLIRLVARYADIEERAEHLQKVLDAVTSYVKAMVGDTCYCATCRIEDNTGYLVDATGDIVGALTKAAETLRLEHAA